MQEPYEKLKAPIMTYRVRLSTFAGSAESVISDNHQAQYLSSFIAADRDYEADYMPVAGRFVVFGP